MHPQRSKRPEGGVTNWPILNERYSCNELATTLHALEYREADIDGGEDPLAQLSFNRSTCSDGKQSFVAIFGGYINTEIYARVESCIDGAR